MYKQVHKTNKLFVKTETMTFFRGLNNEITRQVLSCKVNDTKYNLLLSIVNAVARIHGRLHNIKSITHTATHNIIQAYLL